VEAGPDTKVGKEEATVLLMPKFPLPFDPQAHRVPSVLIPKPNPEPVVTLLHVVALESIVTALMNDVAVASVFAVLPVCPLLFKPHAYNIPAVVVAKAWLVPAPTRLQLVAVGPLTMTGLLTVVVLPKPTWPLVFCPQPYNTPAVVIAILKLLPAAMLLQLVDTGPDTRTGELTVTVLLIPTCPLVFVPQAHNLPSLLIARV
jgi:hypothetical protein